MISEEVRSTKGRPRASTPVAMRGTACTIRVLRRFLNSVPVLTTPSDTISAASSAKLPPESFIQARRPSVCSDFSLARGSNATAWLPCLRSIFRGRPAVCSGQKHPSFFCDPDWPYQQINRSLVKRRTISLNAVAEKKKHPPANKKSRSPNPLHKKEQDDAGKNHRDPDTMQESIRAGCMFVIVLRHVVRQARHQRTSCQPSSTAIQSAGEQPPWNPYFILKSGDLLGGTISTESSSLFHSCKSLQFLGLFRLAFAAALGRGDVSYSSLRPSMAFSIVTSSAYSMSAPTGIPTPIRVTRTPSGFSNLERYTAVASPSAVGFVAMIISSTIPAFKRSMRDLM